MKRLVRDYEQRIDVSEAMIHLAAIWAAIIIGMVIVIQWPGWRIQP